MRVLRRLIARDFRDQALIWAILGFLTAVPPVVRLFLPGFALGAFYGYAYFLFLLVYCGQVWNFASGQALSREYLLSLPVSRASLFAVMWARCLVGAVPLALHTLLSTERLRSSFHVGGPDGLLGGLPGPLQAGAFLGGVIAILFASLGVSFNIQELWKTAGRGRRVLQIGALFVWLILDLGSLLLWWFAFQPVFSAPVALLAVAVTLAYVALKGWIAYRRWRAGPDSRLFSRSGGRE